MKLRGGRRLLSDVRIGAAEALLPSDAAVRSTGGSPGPPRRLQILCGDHSGAALLEVRSSRGSERVRVRKRLRKERSGGLAPFDDVWSGGKTKSGSGFIEAIARAGKERWSASETGDHGFLKNAGTCACTACRYDKPSSATRRSKVLRMACVLRTSGAVPLAKRARDPRLLSFSGLGAQALVA